MTVTQDTDTILYDVTDGIALITLNRPDRLNAFLPDMLGKYAGLLRKADADPSVRVIVVTGAGRGFCPGADLKGFELPEEEIAELQAAQSVTQGPSVALLIGTPVVTAINGPAAGMGFVIAIAADARFAAESATFTTSFVKLGLPAEYGSAWLLTRLVGLGNATDLLLTSRKINAAEALAMGLVNGVSDNALEAAMAWARQVVATSSPHAMSVMKRQLVDGDGGSFVDSVVTALAEMPAAFAHADYSEAIDAMIEKRPPNWG